jgi:hypothetical protein
MKVSLRMVCQKGSVLRLGQMEECMKDSGFKANHVVKASRLTQMASALGVVGKKVFSFL